MSMDMWANVAFAASMFEKEETQGENDDSDEDTNLTYI